jgi:hypothetical protein
MKFLKYFLLLIFCKQIFTHNNLDIKNMISLNYAPNNDVASSGALFTISVGGQYYIASNITAAPTNNNVAGIRIDADNVILNLNNNIITHSSATNFIGIEIVSGKSNIMIIGGNIASIDGIGIKVNSGCSNVSLDSLNISKCTNKGVEISSSSNLVLKNLKINNCDGSNTNAIEGAIGAKLTSCSITIIENSLFSNNQTTTKDSTGLFLSACSDCKIKNCDASVNKGVNTYGFRIANTTTATLFENCFARNNQSASGACYGFHVNSSNNNFFTECIASTNTTTSSNSFGFYFTASRRNRIIGCDAIGQDAASFTGSSWGFCSTGGNANIFESCKSIGNLGGTASSSVAVGFELTGGETFSVIENCESQSNNGGSLGTGYGIKLGNSDSTDHLQLSIGFNYMAGNRGAKYYGYKDFATNTTTLLYNNISFGHGTILPLGGDGNIIDSGTLNYMLKFTRAGGSASNIITESDQISLNSISSTNTLNNFSLITR